MRRASGDGAIDEIDGATVRRGRRARRQAAPQTNSQRLQSAIKSVRDLKGKKLACAEATPSHYFALYVLTQGGLTNRDVEWVFTTSAVEAANVFKAGRVDAAVSWSPDVYIAAREGWVTIELNRGAVINAFDIRE